MKEGGRWPLFFCLYVCQYAQVFFKKLVKMTIDLWVGRWYIVITKTKEADNMTTMKFVTVQNIHGETYNITVRKHSEAEIINDYGYPYSIKIKNANPKAFDLNTHVFLYDDWQTACKRLRELANEYKTIQPRIMEGVDGETGFCV